MGNHVNIRSVDVWAVFVVKLKTISSSSFNLCTKLLTEANGDHLDAETKISLGAIWAHKAGNDFRYYMVYERRAVDGAHTLDNFLNILREI